MRTKRKTKKTSAVQWGGANQMIGDKLSFAAAEAYKLLRTNLFFCLPTRETPSCRVIGMTSSVQGEGKSTTSINLSYMLAQDGKRVCLIEGDMRAPNLSRRLNVEGGIGLAHILAGIKTSASLLQKTELTPNLSVIIAGEMPPNPAELLGTERMAQLINMLKKMFDFIIVDLPPITVVADALTVSNTLDGMIVVVENGVCTKRELSDAIQRLEVIRNKILGFVITRADTGKSRYGKKYGKYGKYGYSTENEDV